MKVLVVGFGFGARHVRLLEDLGCETAVVSRRDIEHPRRYTTLKSALHAWQPGYVVVANETAAHRAVLKELADGAYTGRVLVEKPVFDAPQARFDTRFSHAAVAYQFRCHPLVVDLARHLEGEKLIEARVHVGQWLPVWQPDRDYRQTSYAQKAKGGGVLRDISHELDLALHLFGSWQRLTALGGHLSDLEIDTEDSYALLMQTQRCPSVTVTLNYLDRPKRRAIVVNTQRATYSGDLFTGVLEKDGAVLARYDTTPDALYTAQHQAMIAGDTQRLCSLAEGLAVLDVIAATERANAERIWVHNST